MGSLKSIINARLSPSSEVIESLLFHGLFKAARRAAISGLSGKEKEIRFWTEWHARQHDASTVGDIHTV